MTTNKTKYKYVIQIWYL